MQQTALSCCSNKYCSYTLFPVSAEATAAYPPLPPRPLAQIPEPHCSFPAILPFLLHFLVAMETHVIYVPCVALETGEHPRRGWETHPCRSYHTRGRCPLMAGGESRAERAAGLSLDSDPSANASVTQEIGGHLLAAPKGQR